MTSTTWILGDPSTLWGVLHNPINLDLDRMFWLRSFVDYDLPTAFSLEIRSMFLGRWFHVESIDYLTCFRFSLVTMTQTDNTSFTKLESMSGMLLRWYVSSCCRKDCYLVAYRLLNSQTNNLRKSDTALSQILWCWTDQTRIHWFQGQLTRTTRDVFLFVSLPISWSNTNCDSLNNVRGSHRNCDG